MKILYYSLLSVFFLTSAFHAFGQTNTFPPSGNVGIGTTSPQRQLEIRFNNSNVTTSQMLISQLGGGDSWLNISIPSVSYAIGVTSTTEDFLIGRAGAGNHYGPQTNTIFRLDRNGNRLVLGGINSNPTSLVLLRSGGSQSWKIENNGTLRFLSGSDEPDTERVRITSAGNVGIGTTNPGAKLGISVSEDGAELLKFLTDRPWVFRQVSSGETTGLDLHSTINSKSFTISSSNNSVLARFHTSINADTRRVILVPDGGNVGIGTSSPTHRLEVNGTVRAKEVKLEANNWPDYVFSEGYRLPSLEETQSFIEAHGHLPGFKPAAEYEAEGVNILELNQKLLEKIEELTLYVIDQRSVMGDQHERIRELNRKIQEMESELQELKRALKHLL